MNEIAMGTRRCLTECEIFPTIAHFIEKAKTNPMVRAGQWTDVPKIEQAHKRVQKEYKCPMNLKICTKSF